jgi:pyruvate formate lyase activating enzyme
VVVRDWYVLREYGLTDDGHCVHCGAPVHGVFAGPAGDWGSRRQPVRLSGPVPVGAPTRRGSA